jgi:hypothetical protein
MRMTPSAEPTRRAWDRFHELAVTDEAIVHDGDRVLSAHVAAAAGTRRSLAAYFAAQNATRVYGERGLTFV